MMKSILNSFSIFFILSILPSSSSGERKDQVELSDMVKSEVLIEEGGNIGNSGKIYTSVDKPAEFPGGLSALMKWLGENLIYPPSSLERGAKGRVMVKFVVRSDGSIGDAEIVKSVDPDLDAEALRVIKKMPRWIPGENNGFAVNTWFTLPITFNFN